MADDVAELRRPDSCPRCGAGVRPDAPWCTQCYLDLRPAPASPTAPTAPTSPTAPAPDPGAGPAAQGVPPGAVRAVPVVVPATEEDAGWPCSGCGRRTPFEQDACVCGLPFLGRLRLEDRPSLALPLLGDLSRLSRAQRTGGALGVVVAVVLLAALLAVLLT